MPNPADKMALEAKAQATNLRRLGALLLAEARVHTMLLNRLVELGEHSKAALDAMQQGEPGEYSVRGLAEAEPETPFIGG